MRRLALLAAVLIAFAATTAIASADGEAGLVIQEGDTVITYCIPFAGDSATGEALLSSAGIEVEQFGGSSGRAVCALDDTGCFDNGSFESCFCQCQGGECTYWAFFTQRYGGAWVYSALAFNLVRGRDGDVHGWKWGRGSQQSAPSPAPITFEQICGHAPRGGVTVPAVTATATPMPMAAASPTPTVSSGGATPGSNGDPTATPTTPGAPAASATQTSAPPRVVITIGAPTPAPGVPAAGEPESGDPGGIPAGVVAFAGVAVVLASATGLALYRRRARGA